jgi:hypothetical protein
MNWRSTLGGSLSALGKSLIGVGVVPQLAGVSSKFLLYVAIAGFLIDAIGSFFAHLFSADAKSLQQLANVVQSNTQALVSGDTTQLRKLAGQPGATPAG